MRYNVIYADPPWIFRTYSSKGKGRSAERHYECLSFAEMCKIPVPSFSADDCALFLWVTDPLLPRGLELMREWGFQYKTVAFCWAKLNPSAGKDGPFFQKDFHMGTGYWTRANSEQCLLGTRGKPRRKSKNVRRLVVSPRREHSRKPDEISSAIVDLMGDVPRIELFARTTRTGWDNWGLQPNKF